MYEKMIVRYSFVTHCDGGLEPRLVVGPTRPRGGVFAVVVRGPVSIRVGLARPVIHVVFIQFGPARPDRFCVSAAVCLNAVRTFPFGRVFVR